MRVADYIIEFLIAKGITKPFVVTGRGALFLNDALAKAKDMEPVFPHHEQSAAFAAVAAADLSQSPQAAIVSTGCASTNVMTGLLSAWQDHLPLIVISGQNTLKETTRHTGLDIKTYGQQEADIIALVEPISKYAVMLEDPARVRYELEKMFHMATEGAMGPVWLDVPLDIQNARVEPDVLDGFEAPTEDRNVAHQDVDRLVRAFSEADRPVFLIGAGVRRAQAEQALGALCAEKSIPLVYTASAVDVIPASEPVSIGSLGSQGCSRAGAFTIQNADLVVILGSRMTTLTTGPDVCGFAPKAKVIAVDINATEHQKAGLSYDSFIQADVGAVLDVLVEQMARLPSFDPWLQQAQQWKIELAAAAPFENTDDAVDLHDVADRVGDVLPETGVFVCDSGFIDVIVPTNAAFRKGQRVIRPVSQGAMGFALPGAIGVAATSARPVLCMVGDGSIMMNLQELETIARCQLNIKIVVVVNGMYAIIKRRQTELFRRRTIGVDEETGLNTPNFQKIAAAFDLSYVVCTPQTYETVLAEQLIAPGPALIALPGKVDQDYVEIGYGRDDTNRLVRRPLEDQKPFLDRAFFAPEKEEAL
ncbi:MAG: thiamine pyrophosphate-binding protein [Pseudomonadota bacterium]